MNLSDLKIDNTWSLFLDRDGVINRRIVDDYVRKWEEFEFLPGVHDAFKVFAKVFGPVIVVSNQQGVGKGIMTDQAVVSTHNQMIRSIRLRNGRLDKVYYSPYLEKAGSTWRKPNIGMALEAQKDFPQIIFRKSVMVGDSETDMIFGRKLQMKTVFINSMKNHADKFHDLVDFIYPDLASFAHELDLSFRLHHK